MRVCAQLYCRSRAFSSSSAHMRRESRTTYVLAAGLYAAASFLPLAHSFLEWLQSECVYLWGREHSPPGHRSDGPILYEGTESHRSLHDPRSCMVCLAAATGSFVALEPPLGGARGPGDESCRQAPEPSCVLASSRAWLSPPARGPPALS